MSPALALVMGGMFGAPPDRVSAAAASPRPAECRLSGAGASVWRQARTPMLERYCSLLARGEVELVSSPARALGTAEAAAASMPTHAGAHVLLGRANLALGRFDASTRAFGRALELDPKSVDSPVALAALARARFGAGDLAGAVHAYRRLVPLASLLPGPGARVTLLRESAHAVMRLAAASATSDDIRTRFDEALGYLRQAAREARGNARLDVALSLALCLDRSGQRGEADALLDEQAASASWTQRTHDEASAVERDRDVLEALALEREAPSDARAAYQRYLASADMPQVFAASAQARARSLDKTKAVARPPRAR